MTRETKIGLLVGLAFIIIVGILLGDSVRHATDVQPAPLPQVGTNVRSAVATPGTPTAVAPASAAAQGQQANTQQQQNVQPNQMVPTHEEVAHPHGIDVVVVGPGNGTIANGAGQGSGSSSTGPHHRSRGGLQLVPVEMKRRLARLSPARMHSS